MGILTKVRNGIVKAAEKGADAVSAMSQLSPAQVRAIDDDRLMELVAKHTLDKFCLINNVSVNDSLSCHQTVLAE